MERNALKMFLYFQSTLLKYITCILLVIAIIYKINVSVEFSNKTNEVDAISFQMALGHSLRREINA